MKKISTMSILSAAVDDDYDDDDNQQSVAKC